ncbi:hypothetical protein [Nocardia rhizosphaerihabitans]|uniref:Uncharacterized protein n=1 Tax=Nocardia rhizosphaerihabitans TaxID=1691570 RepID=A0ABQ2K2H8_9NOCA|nr:hypothetical protein [Nocardia rhizosphaerihabitans]GGN66040.1 hypothetical protein GCM10011610_00560 [Nocardia rhizosphaerihabitans]
MSENEAQQTTPNQAATLSLAYSQDQPAIEFAQGSAIPTTIPVVDGDGRVVAVYRAEAVPQPQAQSRSFTTADHAAIYAPEHGLFDVSYASAWTLGR